MSGPYKMRARAVARRKIIELLEVPLIICFEIYYKLRKRSKSPQPLWYLTLALMPRRGTLKSGSMRNSLIYTATTDFSGIHRTLIFGSSPWAGWVQRHAGSFLG